MNVPASPSGTGSAAGAYITLLRRAGSVAASLGPLALAGLTEGPVQRAERAELRTNSATGPITFGRARGLELGGLRAPPGGQHEEHVGPLLLQQQLLLLEHKRLKRACSKRAQWKRAHPNVVVHILDEMALARSPKHEHRGMRAATGKARSSRSRMLVHY